MVDLSADALMDAIVKAGDSFAPGELAYLALTSKPELPLRDRLAWVLHSEPSSYVVAREWAASNTNRSRTDLAILDSQGQAPIALLEAKAAYTFDFAAPERATVAKYRSWIVDDLDKARRASNGQAASVFALLLLTHPCGVPTFMPNVIKYVHQIRSSVRGNNEQDLRNRAERTAIETLSGLGPVKSGRLNGGVAFGVKVAVDVYLVGPIPVPLIPGDRTHAEGG